MRLKQQNNINNESKSHSQSILQESSPLTLSNKSSLNFNVKALKNIPSRTPSSYHPVRKNIFEKSHITQALQQHQSSNQQSIYSGGKFSSKMLQPQSNEKQQLNFDSNQYSANLNISNISGNRPQKCKNLSISYSPSKRYLVSNTNIQQHSSDSIINREVLNQEKTINNFSTRIQVYNQQKTTQVQHQYGAVIGIQQDKQIPQITNNSQNKTPKNKSGISPYFQNNFVNQSQLQLQEQKQNLNKALNEKLFSNMNKLQSPQNSGALNTFKPESKQVKMSQAYSNHQSMKPIEKEKESKQLQKVVSYEFNYQIENVPQDMRISQDRTVLYDSSKVFSNVSSTPPSKNRITQNTSDQTFKQTAVFSPKLILSPQQQHIYPVQIQEVENINFDDDPQDETRRTEFKAMSLAKIASTSLLIQDPQATLYLSTSSLIQESSKSPKKDQSNKNYNQSAVQAPQGTFISQNQSWIISESDGASKLEHKYESKQLPCVKIELISQIEKITEKKQSSPAKHLDFYSSLRGQNCHDILSSDGEDFHLKVNDSNDQPIEFSSMMDQSQVSDVMDEKSSATLDSQKTIVQDQTDLPVKKSLVKNFRYNFSRFQNNGNQQQPGNQQSGQSPPRTYHQNQMYQLVEKNVEESKHPYPAQECETSDQDDWSKEEDDCQIIEKEEQMIASLLTMQGIVYKKRQSNSSKYHSNKYKEYYGIVRNKRFKYYSDKTMKKLGGIIDFDRVQCVVMIDDDENSSDEESNSPPQDLRRFRIEVIGCKRHFIFKVPSSSHLRRWTQSLYSNWNSSKSFTLANSHAMLSSPFWKVDFIRQSEFRRLADTGDILLFQSSSFVTKVQRAITMSEYDHVAMLLRYSNGKLVIFESTGQTGVAVLDWDVFVKNNWHNLYQKLAYRKLRNSRTMDNMSKLENFIRTVIGMKYKLNATKILRRHYENDAENIKGDKSYFCSELVASAYKCLQLLPKEISASQYWPGSFSNKSNVKLLGRALLEDEQQIEFSS